MTAARLGAGPPRVLVLGGTGSVGHKLSQALAALGHPVLVGSRDHDRAHDTARRIAGAEAATTEDLRHPAINPPREGGFVVNCTGEEDPAIAAAWVSQGWGFMDITASSQYCLELSRLDTGSRPIVAGVGLMPGLSGLVAVDLARSNPTATHITLSGLLGLADDHGAASSRWTIGRLGRRVEDRDSAFRNFSEPAAIDFPAGFGRRRAWRNDFADRVMLPERTNLDVTTRYCFDSRIAGEAMAFASMIPGGPRVLLKLAPLFEGSRRGTDWFAFVARTDSGGEVHAVGRSQSWVTAELTAEAVDICLRTPPEPGFHYLTDLATLADIEDRLATFGVLIDRNRKDRP